MGTWLEQPSPSDFDRWEALVYEKRIPPWEAAKQLGFGGSSTFKRTDPQRHYELLTWWRASIEEEDREYVRDKLKENVEQAMRAVPVLDREGNEIGEFTFRGDVANRSLELLGKTVGMFADTQRVELTGADGGAVAIEDRSATLSDIARILHASGALVGLPVNGSTTDRAELPAAGEVLPVSE